VVVTAPDAELRRVWRRAVTAGHDAACDALLGRHREPHRRYHTAAHVLAVCRHVDHLVRHHPVPDHEAVLAAALFHDAVYDARSAHNEENSAALAERVLSDVGWAPDRIAEVVRLVLLTAGHRPHRGDASGAVLVDADLAVLGDAPTAYAAYVAGVRAEYAHVDDGGWRRGRAQVLRRFLAQPSIFTTATMCADREQRARANLAAELAALG
jgi:predicted metal-dependent HD superfamily phosphohydrolase